MGSTHPSHAMRDTPHHSQEVCPLPPLFRVKGAPSSYLRLCDHEGGLPPPNPHPIYGSYISRRILWIPLVSFKIFRRIPWNLRISFQNISKNPPLLLVLFQNFLKNPLDSSCIPLNISKNPEVSSHHLSIHVQFHRKFLRVTGGGAKTGCRLKRFWHRQSGYGSTITGQKKSSPVFHVTGDFSRKWYNPSG